MSNTQNFSKKKLFIIVILALCFVVLGMYILHKYTTIQTKNQSKIKSHSIMQNDSNIIDPNNAIKHTGSYDDKD